MNIPYRIKRKIIRTMFREQWSLLVCDFEGTILTHIVPPVEYNGKTYIFVERQIGSGNGTIGVIELFPDNYSEKYMLRDIKTRKFRLSSPGLKGE
jgi:hypothetical protein